VEGEAFGGDLRDREAVARAARGCDVVFHLASVVDVRRDFRDMLHAVNVGGTRNVIDACQSEKVPRLVYCSSASVVYDGHDIENGDETMPYGRSGVAPYADTKRIAEELVLAANSSELATCSIRPHIVFGPGDTRMLPEILKHAAGPVPLVIGDPRKLSDFTYVDNAADALLLAADTLRPGSAAAGNAYFVSNGEPRPYWAFINAILARMGRRELRRRVPLSIAWAAAWLNEKTFAPRTGSSFTTFTVGYLSTHHYFNHARATRDFGYRPRVSLDEGIARTAAAFAGG
jgi:sterol-4alpha-carboxylate 3-dehydrogenase (decarboxylating)